MSQSMSAAIPSKLREIFNIAHNTKKVSKGAYLFQEGFAASELYIVLDGKIMISKIIPDGKELAIRVCSKNDIVGEWALFSPSPKQSMNAKVMENSEVAIINKDDLEAELSINAAMAVEYMKWMSLQSLKNQTKFRDLILHGKKGALYSTLIRLSNSYGAAAEHGTIISFPLTNQELANFCGTSREVVNRMLSDLRKMKIISVNKGLITIHNIEYLKRSIDCENCPVEICNME